MKVTAFLLLVGACQVIAQVQDPDRTLATIHIDAGDFGLGAAPSTANGELPSHGELPPLPPQLTELPPAALTAAGVRAAPTQPPVAQRIIPTTAPFVRQPVTQPPVNPREGATLAPHLIVPLPAAPHPVVTGASNALTHLGLYNGDKVGNLAKDCTDFMSQTGCDWTLQHSCPGQAQGGAGFAADDGSKGFLCCCTYMLWKESQKLGILTPGSATNDLDLAGPEFRDPKESIGFEQIPRNVKLTYKLMQWFESRRQCPLDNQGYFPAWAGWKAVTANTPAITTPNKGKAGNRTLVIQDFCPLGGLRSTDFKCVRTEKEIKARAVYASADNRFKPRIAIDDLRCTLQDISLYRMDDNSWGVRMDFAGCEGATDIGAVKPHVPLTASLNMGVREQAVGEYVTNFTEFFMGVCQPGSQPSTWLTTHLPKFERMIKQTAGGATNGVQVQEMPTCFAESANTAHVLGKGCFNDFLFFTLEDVMGRIASIPASDALRLKAMIPGVQRWPKPKARLAPYQLETEKMIYVPAPAPPPKSPCAEQNPVAETTTLPPVPAKYINPCKMQNGSVDDPCKPQVPTCATYKCQLPFVARPHPDDYLCHDSRGCTVVDRQICCLTLTTTTTTGPEVPGVVVADRMCLYWAGCGACDNHCSCSPKERVSCIPTAANNYCDQEQISPESICEDRWAENAIIAAVSSIAALFIMILCMEKCVLPGWKRVHEPEMLKDRESLHKAAARSYTIYGGAASVPPMVNNGVEAVVHKHETTTKWDTAPSLGDIQRCDYTKCWFPTTCTLMMLAAIVAFVSVHCVWMFWRYCIGNLTEQEGNFPFQINITKTGCEFTLWPIWVAEALMLWFCTSYYWAFNKESRVHEYIYYPLRVDAMARSGFGACNVM